MPRQKENKTKTKSNEANTTIKNLADPQFRKEYRALLNNAPKTKNALPWKHKEHHCLAHHIMPLIPFKHDVPEACQCNKIKIDGMKRQYRISLETVLKPHSKDAYHDDLNIVINDQHSMQLNVLSVKAGEIKKMTQPATRKYILGTGSFFKGRSIVNFAGKYYIEFRLKDRYQQKQVKNEKKLSKLTDVADFWYQNFMVTGVWHVKKNLDAPIKLFIAIHINPWIGGWEQCAKRIIMSVFAKDNEEIKTLKINKQSIPTVDRLNEIAKEANERRKSGSSSPGSSQTSSSTSLSSSSASLSELSDAHSIDTSVSSIQCPINRELALAQKTIQELKQKNQVLEATNKYLEHKLKKNEKSINDLSQCSSHSSQGSQGVARGYSRSYSLDDVDRSKSKKIKALKSEKNALKKEVKILQNRLKDSTNLATDAQFVAGFRQKHFVYSTPPTPPKENDENSQEPPLKKRRIE